MSVIREDDEEVEEDSKWADPELKTSCRLFSFLLARVSAAVGDSRKSKKRADSAVAR